jgi:CRISPR-associated protein Cas1
MNDEPADLIPARALNQVSYCPRLYYLEYVDAVMPVNEFVEDGSFQHRRINSSTLAKRTRKEGDVLRTRSVSLSSESLGLIAKLDVLEEEEGAIRPVESKRSAAPKGQNGEPTYRINDAIQLCGQGMLVEEAFGVSVSRGVLYYMGSKTQIDVPLDETLRERTRAAIAQIKELSAAENPPEPLPAELRHRCFGCSLASVCLPEETLYASSGPAPSPLQEYSPETAKSNSVMLTRVVPLSDEKAVLYLQEPGSHVCRRAEHLVVTIDSVTLNKVPIASIRQVVVFGNVQVSTQALLSLAENEISVVYLTAYGKFVAAFTPPPAKNAALRSRQYQAFGDPEIARSLSRSVVAAKIANQRTLLMRSLRSQPCGFPGDEDDEDGTATEPPPARGSDEPAARQMLDMLKRVETAPDTGVLLGLEGQAAALYFGEFNRMLRSRVPGDPFDFTSRNRRPPRDPVNALLSFAYALLCKDCFSAACTVGFDPYYGFYHVGRHGRPSLALDMMEEFRAIIADSVVLNLINNGMLTKSDFLTWRGSCQLSDAGRATFFRAYEQRKGTEVTHPIFGYRMTYGRMIEVQARMLAAFIRGEHPRYIGFTVR